jgi:hypothetical protein
LLAQLLLALNLQDEIYHFVSKVNGYTAMSKQEFTQAGIHTRPFDQAQIYVCETGVQNSWKQVSNEPPATACDSQPAGKCLILVKTGNVFNGHHSG